MIRCTDSHIFNHEPESGVYNGMMPLANIHNTNSGVLCPIRLSSTRSSRNGGSAAGKVIGSCKPACHSRHCSRLTVDINDSAGGSCASIAVNSIFSHGCSTAFGHVVTPLALTSPLDGRKERQQFRGAVPNIFMILTLCRATLPPALSGHRNRLKWSGLRPVSRLPASSPSPICKLVRSAFFCFGINIHNTYPFTTLAPSDRDPGFAPGARLPPAETRFFKDCLNCIGADFRQPVRRTPQSIA